MNTDTARKRPSFAPDGKLPHWFLEYMRAMGKFLNSPAWIKGKDIIDYIYANTRNHTPFVTIREIVSFCVYRWTDQVGDPATPPDRRVLLSTWLSDTQSERNPYKKRGTHERLLRN